MLLHKRIQYFSVIIKHYTLFFQSIVMGKFCIYVCMIVDYNGIFIPRPHVDMQMWVWYCFFIKVIQQTTPIA